MATRPVTRVAALLALLPLAAACVYRLQRHVSPSLESATLDGKSPYLKAHLRSGYVYVLADWGVDSGGSWIHGTGRLLDVNRRTVREGSFHLATDSVALFETNTVRASEANTALTVMAGVTAAVTVYCLANPKSCFGSCPTFYATDGATERLQAEGFSASIAPALEATDLDMLYRARPRGRDFALRLTNEALETHVLRRADLLVAARPPGGRVFVTPGGTFRAATAVTAPSRCSGADGDCRAAILAFDGVERFTPTDSTDLAAREVIDLDFDRVPPGDAGIVISSRQTLLTTFLIYQFLAYMGDDAARWFVALGTGGPEARRRASAIGDALGRIEVLVPDSMGRWRLVGTVGETGPLAVDTKVVRLPPGSGSRHVRLRLTRGLWRLDYVAMAALGDTVHPVRLSPAGVWRDGRPDADALRVLRDTATALVTLPGDEYRLAYRLPGEAVRHEIFLEARGYYLEWMRREWIAEQNPFLAARLAFDPARALRDLAPLFKRQEPDMERLFWNSRYARH